MQLFYQYMVIFLNFSLTSNHLQPLQVENSGLKGFSDPVNVEFGQYLGKPISHCGLPHSKLSLDDSLRVLCKKRQINGGSTSMTFTRHWANVGKTSRATWRGNGLNSERASGTHDLWPEAAHRASSPPPPRISTPSVPPVGGVLVSETCLGCPGQHGVVVSALRPDARPLPRLQNTGLNRRRLSPSKHDTSIQCWAIVVDGGPTLDRCVVFAGRSCTCKDKQQ